MISDFTSIGGYESNPVFSKGSGLDFDSGGIREIGNTFWDNDLQKYIFSYFRLFWSL